MRTPTCTRRIQFAAGHRVLGHENKCANVHGHNYVVFFEARAMELDSIGRVIDFSVLKSELGGWIDQAWDHGFIVSGKDQALREALSALNGPEGKPTKVWAAPFNPTAEEMANYLLRVVGPGVLEGSGVELIRVVVWETENCFATAEL